MSSDLVKIAMDGDMNYNQFIQLIIDTRGQWSNVYDIDGNAVYQECHHIIPRSLGGLPESSDKNIKHENLIWLLADEHFYAHKLYAIENAESYEATSSWFMMLNCTAAATNKRSYEVTPEDYKLCREIMSESFSKKFSGSGNPMFGKLGENNPNFGRKHSQEFRDNLSKRMSGPGNPMFGKRGKRDEQFCKATSDGLKKYWENISEEEYENRRQERVGDKNGMFGKYGLINRCVHVKCVETGEQYVSICDAERKTGINGIKRASKTGCRAGGYHWERI